MSTHFKIEFDYFCLKVLREAIIQDDFKNDYLKNIEDKKNFIKYVGLFLADLYHKKDPMYSAFQEVFKCTKKQQKTQLESIAEGWLKKAYFYALKNDTTVSQVLFCKFIEEIFKPKENERRYLRLHCTKTFRQIRNRYMQKQFRVRNNSRIGKLQAKYPKIDIQKAYTYAVISGKFKIKNEDIKIFERILLLLKK